MGKKKIVTFWEEEAEVGFRQLTLPVQFGVAGGLILVSYLTLLFMWKMIVSP